MYGPSSFMVDDYTAEREREREREREKRKMFFPITKIFKNNTERRRSIV